MYAHKDGSTSACVRAETEAARLSRLCSIHSLHGSCFPLFFAFTFLCLVFIPQLCPQEFVGLTAQAHEADSFGFGHAASP